MRVSHVNGAHDQLTSSYKAARLRKRQRSRNSWAATVSVRGFPSRSCSHKVAMSAVTFMVLTSLPIVRARLQGLFRICHFVGLGTAVLGLAFHMPRTGLIACVC